MRTPVWPAAGAATEWSWLILLALGVPASSHMHVYPRLCAAHTPAPSRGSTTPPTLYAQLAWKLHARIRADGDIATRI
ncbi:uncharacterized protein V1518DRAFT_418082 [Limtongia smithiae]|uniref:uncharacterized protein n=1 Tax=Limtongia smithiae TaxID=1125753 RepID=UPI0034CD2B93